MKIKWWPTGSNGLCGAHELLNIITEEKMVANRSNSLCGAHKLPNITTAEKMVAYRIQQPHAAALTSC
jgi:hypothetical protein